MSEQPLTGQQQPTMNLEPMQVCALLVIDSVSVALQTGMNQLGGFLGLKREAEMLGNALSHLQRDKNALLAEWQKRIVVAPAAALSVIEGKKTH